MPTLYCPKCGYNLTGLPQNSCPECGAAFDPEELVRRQNTRRPPFIQGVIYVLIPPSLFLFSWPAVSYLNKAGNINENVWTALGVFFFSAIVIGGLISSVVAARRLARRLARKHPTDPPSPATVGMTVVFTIVFLWCQIVLAPMFLLLGCACTGGK